MTFLARIAARTAPVRPGISPKGIVSRAPATDVEEDAMQALRGQSMEEEEEAQTLRRQEEEEEKEAQPIRRQEEEEEAQTLRRQEKEEEEEAQPIRRQEDEEEAQTLRRQEKEEEAIQALRRQPMEEEEESAQALRRQAQEEEEDAQPLRHQANEEEEAMQPLRRESSVAALDPETAPFPEEMRNEAEPPDLTALRRDGVDPAGAIAVLPPAFNPGAIPDIGGAEPPPGDRFNRPSVHIDQLDVMIHEPVASPRVRVMDRNRAIRARYLRRL